MASGEEKKAQPVKVDKCVWEQWPVRWEETRRAQCPRRTTEKEFGEGGNGHLSQGSKGQRAAYWNWPDAGHTGDLD